MCRRLSRWLPAVVLVGLLWVAWPVAAQTGAASTFDLQAALASAAPGAVIQVPAGTYAAPLVLDKPVTLEGQGWPVIQGDGSGDVVAITAPGVALRGFVVRGSGVSLDREDSGIRVAAAGVTVENNRVEDALFGIYLENAPRGVVRGNLVVGKALPISRRGDGLKIWYSADSLIEGNTVRDARDVVIWFSPRTAVRKNTIEHGRYGLHFMSTDEHLAEENILRHNSVGIYLMYGSGYTLRRNLLLDNHGPSGYGIGLKEVSAVVVEGNRLIGNRVGVYADGAVLRPDTTARFQSNLFAYNEIGALLLPNVHFNTYTQNVFLDNNEQVAISGGGTLADNNWAEAGRGNYWSDYAGFDADGDQVGDLPYEAKSLYESLMAVHPELRLFQLSPASDALDLAAKAFPIFQPRSKMADPAPLIAPPSVPVVPGLPQPPVLANLLGACLLVLVAMAVLWAGTRRPHLPQCD